MPSVARNSLLTRTLGTPRATRFFFNIVAPIYRWLTNNPLWRSSIKELARHLPPSAATLRLLDVGCGHGNSAYEMLALRPDLRVIGVDFSISMLKMARRTENLNSARPGWTQADALRLPLPDNSMDAVTAHSLFYMLADRDAFLRETLRVLRPGGRLILLDPVERPLPFGRLIRRPGRISLALFAWHLVSRAHRRFTLAEMVMLLEQAGFERVLTERAAEGFGVLSRGEKSYTRLSTAERIAGTAALDQPIADDLMPHSAESLQTALRGRFVFVLVRQTASKRPWEMMPDDLPRWDAVMVQGTGQSTGHGNRPALLVFSSLPRAVEFMQPAVKSGTLKGINKIAKFDKAVALGWGVDTLLNPAFDALQASPAYRFDGLALAVDPALAITGEE